mmetsp:Transcript_99381/g.285932  ORF Transcript_99381/g.285932 Transcript_99381/m.285932 type:complete len:206 (+) Transcript_99381:763-1380(+)
MSFHRNFFHGTDDYAEVILIQIRKEERLGKNLLQTVFLLIRLRDDRRHECLLLVPLPVGLCGDALASLALHRLVKVRGRLVVLVILLLFLVLHLRNIARGELRAVLHLCLDSADFGLQVRVVRGHSVLLLRREQPVLLRDLLLLKPVQHERHGVLRHAVDALGHHLLEEGIHGIHDVLLLVLGNLQPIEAIHAVRQTEGHGRSLK